jgi:hypothetical protein
MWRREDGENNAAEGQQPQHPPSLGSEGSKNTAEFRRRSTAGFPRQRSEVLVPDVMAAIPRSPSGVQTVQESRRPTTGPDPPCELIVRPGATGALRQVVTP